MLEFMKLAYQAYHIVDIEHTYWLAREASEAIVSYPRKN